MDDILIVELVVLADFLGVVADGGAPDHGVLHVLHELLVEFVTEALNSRVSARHDDGLLVIGDLTFGLSVNTQQVQILPDLLHELVEVPLVLG